MRNCIGIDVAKKYFDLHCLKTGKDQHMENSNNGIRKCVELCNEIRPELIVMEATGGYELNLAATLQAEGFAVAIVNPRRIRDFARAAGQIAKTDKLDARIIAHFAVTLEPMPTEQISKTQGFSCSQKSIGWTAYRRIQPTGTRRYQGHSTQYYCCYESHRSPVENHRPPN